MKKSSGELEQFLDWKLAEFNEKRVEALQELTFDEILDFNPILFVFRSKYSMAEIAHLLVDQKLMAIEQKLLAELFADLSAFIGEKISAKDAIFRRIIRHIIRQANIFEGIDSAYAQITSMVFKRFYEHCNKSGDANWAALVNLSSEKCGLEELLC